MTHSWPHSWGVAVIIPRLTAKLMQLLLFPLYDFASLSLRKSCNSIFYILEETVCLYCVFQLPWNCMSEMLIWEYSFTKQCICTEMAVESAEKCKRITILHVSVIYLYFPPREMVLCVFLRCCLCLPQCQGGSLDKIMLNPIQNLSTDISSRNSPFVR